MTFTASHEWSFRLTTYVLWSWGNLWPDSYEGTAKAIDTERRIRGIPSVYD